MDVQIRQLRENKRLTQKELADMVDASVRQIGYWEKGNVALADAAKIADVLECSLDELAGREWPKGALGEDERKLVGDYRDTHDYFKPEISDFAERTAARHPKNEAPGDPRRQIQASA